MHISHVTYLRLNRARATLFPFFIERIIFIFIYNIQTYKKSPPLKLYVTLFQDKQDVYVLA